MIVSYTTTNSTAVKGKNIYVYRQTLKSERCSTITSGRPMNVFSTPQITLQTLLFNFIVNVIYMLIL